MPRDIQARARRGRWDIDMGVCCNTFVVYVVVYFGAPCRSWVYPDFVERRHRHAFIDTLVLSNSRRHRSGQLVMLSAEVNYCCNNRVSAIYQILLGWKQHEIVMKPSNSPTQGQPNQRKIKLKEAFGPLFPTAFFLFFS